MYIKAFWPGEDVSRKRMRTLEVLADEVADGARDLDLCFFQLHILLWISLASSPYKFILYRWKPSPFILYIYISWTVDLIIGTIPPFLESDCLTPSLFLSTQAPACRLGKMARAAVDDGAASGSLDAASRVHYSHGERDAHRVFQRFWLSLKVRISELPVGPLEDGHETVSIHHYKVGCCFLWGP